MSKYQSVAQRGTSAFLVDMGDGVGIVWNVLDPTVGTGLPLQSILARGYWDSPSAAAPVVPASLDAQLEAAKHVWFETDGRP
jgi:hypothetical protein